MTAPKVHVVVGLYGMIMNDLTVWTDPKDAMEKVKELCEKYEQAENEVHGFFNTSLNSEIYYGAPLRAKEPVDLARRLKRSADLLVDFEQTVREARQEEEENLMSLVRGNPEILEEIS